MGVIDFVTSRAGIAFFSLVLLVVAFTAIAAYFLGVYTPSYVPVQEQVSMLCMI